MKIRHVISTNGRLPKNPVADPASGVVGAALSLAVSQSRLGNSVDVWGWNDNSTAQHTRWEDTVLWTSPAWAWARFAKWDMRWLAPVLLHSFTQPGVDVLHAHVDPNLLYLPRARVRLLHLQTPVPDPFPPAYRRLLNRADAVICCSYFIRNKFLAATRYPSERTFVVYNGADPEAFHLQEDYRKLLGSSFDKNDFIILFSGAIVPEKGVEQLVRAFAQVQASVPNAVLAIAGGSGLWPLLDNSQKGETYEEKVRKLAQDFNVRFLGNLPRSRMPAAYLAADIIVVPSIWDDPHPTVVCEAMAAGRPVVASQAGGITETVIQGQTGFLVPPGDEEQLSKAIQTLARDASLREKMGIAARKRSSKFTWQASAQRLDYIYRELLESADKRNPSNQSTRSSS